MSFFDDIKTLNFNDEIKVNGNLIPTKSKVYKIVHHNTAFDTIHCSVELIQEKRNMVVKYLLNELTQWKMNILNTPGVVGAEFTDCVTVNVVNQSTEIYGEATTMLKSLNGLLIDPNLSSIEIVQSPDIAWHKGEY